MALHSIFSWAAWVPAQHGRSVSTPSAPEPQPPGRNITTPLVVEGFICGFAMPDAVPWCPLHPAHWDGMQEVRGGSNPLSSTRPGTAFLQLSAVIPERVIAPPV
jgi:hypothetical protein